VIDNKLKEMRLSIKCCTYFSKIRHNFDWFSYHDVREMRKIYIVPTLKSCDGTTKIRINYCPSCGKEIRDIKLYGD